MQNLKRLSSFTVAIGAAAIAFSPPAQAEWPERPISMVIMSKQGGGMDRASRMIGSALSERLGQPMKYVNRPGASGQIALKQFIGTKDDGYTVFSGNIPTLMMMMVLRKQDFKFSDKVKWMGAYLIDPALFVVPAASPHNTLKEFIASAKTKPVRMGVANWASVQTLGLLQVRNATGAQMEIIPYSGFKRAATALIGNHIEGAIGNFAATQKLGKKIKRLGVFADQAPGGLKTPAVKSALNVDVIDAASIRALGVHASLAGKHPDRAKKLQSAFDAAIRDAKFKAAFKSIGANPSQAVEWGPKEAADAGEAIIAQTGKFSSVFAQKPKAKK